MRPARPRGSWSRSYPRTDDVDFAFAEASVIAVRALAQSPLVQQGIDPRRPSRRPSSTGGVAMSPDSTKMIPGVRFQPHVASLSAAPGAQWYHRSDDVSSSVFLIAVDLRPTYRGFCRHQHPTASGTAAVGLASSRDASEVQIACILRQ